MLSLTSKEGTMYKVYHVYHILKRTGKCFFFFFFFFFFSSKTRRLIVEDLANQAYLKIIKKYY